MNSFFIKKLYEDAKIPTQKSDGAVGYDLYAYCPKEIMIQKQQISLVPTGIAFEIPKGYFLEIRPRSGLSTKYMLIPNSPGTIDNDYRGEVFVPILNLSNENFTIKNHMRFAQLLIQKAYNYKFQEISEFSKATERNEDGFGSTGLYDD